MLHTFRWAIFTSPVVRSCDYKLAPLHPLFLFPQLIPHSPSPPLRTHIMLLKTLAVLAAAATSVYAQLPKHTFFTSPVGDGITYAGGSKQVFSWLNACTATSPTPTKTEVHLLNANNPNAAYYVATIATIDCTKDQGNVKWTVPEKYADGKTKYALKIDLVPNGVYSGIFKIAKNKTPKHTIFTSPVGTGISYRGGSKQVFSWQKACTSGDSTSQTPTKTEVALVNTNNPNGTFYLETVLTIDCTKENGNEVWTIPEKYADGKTNYALRIQLLPNPAYSGNFKITGTQVPDHTIFTSPVGDGITYAGGSKQVFSWQNACTSGDSTSPTPAKTQVHLVNAYNPDGPFFVDTITTIDCTKENGNEMWTVPEEFADGKTNYALKIDLVPTSPYSAVFKIAKKKTLKHTIFTSPVGTGISYRGGSKQVFSWKNACTSGDSTSPTPAKTEVHLVNANNPDGAFFVDTIATIDCKKDQGNVKWTVPKKFADGKTKYALKIALVPQSAYSGDFKITKS